MPFKISILCLSILFFGCWETHERDNPLDEAGTNWDGELVPKPMVIHVSHGDPDTVLYDCSVPNQENIVRYFIEYRQNERKVVDTSDNGIFPIYVGEEDINTECIVEDKSGSKLRSPYMGEIHRNIPPVFDSTVRFKEWTQMDWSSWEGKGILSVSILDEDGGSSSEYAVRVDLDGTKGEWNSKMINQYDNSLEIEIPLTYGSEPHYRMVVQDGLNDSAVVEGVLLLDTIAPCRNLGRPYFTDIRDGRKYSCAWMNGLGWMTENVDFGVLTPAKNAQSDDNRIERYCPGDSIQGCKQSGGYYQWAEAVGENYLCNKTGNCAMDVHSPRGVCPLGWHMPSRDEWESLVEFLKVNPDHSFLDNLLHGYVDLDGFIQDNENKAYFWTTTTEATTSAIDHSVSIRFSEQDSWVKSLGFRMEERRRGLSVRCVLD